MIEETGQFGFYDESIDDLYHVYTDGSRTPSLLKEESDFIFTLNTIARNLLFTGCSMLAYCLLDSHIHLLIRGGAKQVERFSLNLKKHLLRFFNKDGRILLSHDMNFSQKAVLDINSARRTVCYIIRNSLDVFKNLRPSLYKWSSAKYYFADYSGTHKEGKFICAYLKHDLRSLLNTKFEFPGEWRLLENGLLDPIDYTDYMAVNELFGSFKCFLAFMHLRKDDERDIRLYMMDKKIEKLTDSELRKKYTSLANDYFHKNVNDLVFNENLLLPSF